MPDWFPVSGYASTDDLDRVRDVVVPTAFIKALSDRGIRGPRGIKLLWQHEHSNVLGRITKLEVRNKGLWMEAEIDRDISFANDVILAIEAQEGLSFSIGYRIIEGFLIEPPDGEYYLELTELDLFEVSVVVIPCNESAQIDVYGDKAKPQAANATLNGMIAQLQQFNRRLDKTS